MVYLYHYWKFLSLKLTDPRLKNRWVSFIDNIDFNAAYENNNHGSKINLLKFIFCFNSSKLKVFKKVFFRPYLNVTYVRHYWKYQRQHWFKIYRLKQSTCNSWIFHDKVIQCVSWCHTKDNSRTPRTIHFH